MKKLVTAGLAAAALAVSAGAAMADWPNDQPITFVIPYSPGGGFDTIARAFAPVVEKELGATVVPTNVPGAGGTKGAATVARAEPDGYTIGIYNIPGYTISEVTGTDIGFKLADVTWIANLATESYGIAVKADSEINSLDDLCNLGRPVKLSDTGLQSTSSIAARISFNIMDCPIVNVLGYAGSNDTMIGVMRGEVDATLKPISSLKKYVDSGDLKLIFTYTKKPVMDGVQDANDIGHPDFARLDVRRVIAAPGGLPDDIRNKLSEAFVNAAKSDQIQKWAESSGVELDPTGSDETAATMKDLGDFYTQYKDILNEK